ncbi:hypothetical protein D3C76_1688250 [compost metagenome]
MGLDLRVGQADFTTDHAASVGHSMGDVKPLDAIGNLGATFTDLLAQRCDGFAARLRVA